MVEKSLVDADEAWLILSVGRRNHLGGWWGYNKQCLVTDCSSSAFSWGWVRVGM